MLIEQAIKLVRNITCLAKSDALNVFWTDFVIIGVFVSKLRLKIEVNLFQKITSPLVLHEYGI